LQWKFRSALLAADTRATHDCGDGFIAESNDDTNA